MFRRFGPKGKRDADGAEGPRTKVRFEPLPLSRAILWQPLPDSYHLLASMMRRPEQQAQLFVTQRAFLQVERHLASAPDLELGGFLAGYSCICPKARRPYSVVNTVVPFADVTGDPIGARVTREAYDAVRHRLEGHGLAVIGWYRNGSGLGLQLLPDDVETHLEYFNEPWQTTLLVIPHGEKPKGAFFTYDARVGRGYCIPFYELFDMQAAASNRLDRTCVGWTTYVAAKAVEPLVAGDREIVETTVVPQQSEPQQEPAEPIDEWFDAIKDPWVRLKEVAVGAMRRDPALPLIYEPRSTIVPDPIPAASLEPSARPPARVEARRVPDGPESRQSAGDASQAQASRPERTRLTPPFAGTARPPTRAQPAARAPAVERPVSPTAPAVGDAPSPRPRRSPPKSRPSAPAAAAAIHGAAASPAVALPPDFYDDALRWQRRRRLGFAIAAGSFLAAMALATIRSRPDKVAQAATNAAIPAAAPVSELSGEPVALPSAIDSLSAALDRYRAVAASHAKGRVGCPVLDRAYAAVGRTRTRLDSSRRQIAGGLADSDSIRVSMLAAEFTFVAQTYKRSGCQR